MPLIILAIVTTYPLFLGRHILPLDISAFVMEVLLGQWLSFRLLTFRLGPGFEGIAIIALVALGALFILLTYLPPAPSIFRDPTTEHYGPW